MTTTPRSDEQPVSHLALAEIVFMVAAALIVFFRHAVAAVAMPQPLLTEAAIGIPLGGALGALVGVGLMRSPLRAAVVRGVMPLRPVTASIGSIVLVGLLAGIGEELLFRAALQTWIGLAWASLLLGLAHSGTARLQEGFSAGKLAYLVATIVAGALLGLLYQSSGLVASIAAHACFDIGILLALAPAIAAAVSASAPPGPWRA